MGFEKPKFTAKRHVPNKGKYSDSRDFARFSLWFVEDDYPSKTCCATGVVNVFINGVEHKMRMYLHKSGEDSKCDLYGFIKIDSKIDPTQVFNDFADSDLKQEVIDPEELKDKDDVF